MALTPTALPRISSVAGCGEDHARCGSGIICGDAATNTVVAHQWKRTGAFPGGTSGISTTPHFEQARNYALHDGSYSAGKVIEFDSMGLRNLGVHIFRVKHLVPAPAVAVPEDDEYILVADDFGAIPKSAVVQIHDVTLSAP